MSADTRGDFPLAILAKAPIPGKAKTRLIPAFGADDAAALHERLLRQTLATAAATTPGHRLTLWTALDHAHPLFLELASQYDLEIRAQPWGDLGHRLHRALAAMRGPGMVIGSDCPVLTPDLLMCCWRALDATEAVCLPAEDGGYALIGARRPEARLFEAIDWGSAQVMAQTRRRLYELGWRLACPATVWDVDRPEDVRRWQRVERLASASRRSAC